MPLLNLLACGRSSLVVYTFTLIFCVRYRCPAVRRPMVLRLLGLPLMVSSLLSAAFLSLSPLLSRFVMTTYFAIMHRAS